MEKKCIQPKKILGDYFWLHKLFLKICGVSLEATESLYYRMYKSLTLSLCITLTIEEAYTVSIYLDDIEQLATLISVLPTHVLGVFKIYILLKNREVICETLDRLHDGVFAPNTLRGGPLEVTLIKDCIRDTHRQMYIYYTVGFLTMSNAPIIALVSKHRENDYHLWEEPWVPFGLFEISTTVRYYVVYVYQMVTILIFGCLIMTNDLLIVGVFTHIRAQFNIMSNFLRNIVPEYMRNDSKHCDHKENFTQNLRARSKHAAIYHQQLIKLSKICENLFNVAVLTIFIGNVIVLCFTMYLTTLNSLGSLRNIREATYFLAIVVQVFFYCYYGNEIALASQSVIFACYEANFVGTDLAFQKDLLLIMTRSQKPVILTAGKFANLSLGAFISILRASYSYFMVINRTGKPGSE